MTPTPEQLDDARRWMAARGKEPRAWDGGDLFTWHRDHGISKHYTIPMAVHQSIRVSYHPTREAAIAALALALAECRAACEIEPQTGDAK